MAAPVWVRGPDGCLTYVNRQAESLLGVDASECVGIPCHQVVGGRHPPGRPICGFRCQVSTLASMGQAMEPTEMWIPGANKRGVHIRVVTISVQTPEHPQPSLVHCALDDEKEHALRAYLTRVLSRTPYGGSSAESVDDCPLTKREIEILRLLAEDETLHSIAATLNLSYATVRNHVQHILSKLGVHSIMEAVAYYLLSHH